MNEEMVSIMMKDKRKLQTSKARQRNQPKSGLRIDYSRNNKASQRPRSAIGMESENLHHRRPAGYEIERVYTGIKPSRVALSNNMQNSHGIVYQGSPRRAPAFPQSNETPIRRRNSNLGSPYAQPIFPPRHSSRRSNRADVTRLSLNRSRALTGAGDGNLGAGPGGVQYAPASLSSAGPLHQRSNRSSSTLQAPAQLLPLTRGSRSRRHTSGVGAGGVGHARRSSLKKNSGLVAGEPQRYVVQDRDRIFSSQPTPSVRPSSPSLSSNQSITRKSLSSTFSAALGRSPRQDVPRPNCLANQNGSQDSGRVQVPRTVLPSRAPSLRLNLGIPPSPSLSSDDFLPRSPSSSRGNAAGTELASDRPKEFHSHQDTFRPIHQQDRQQQSLPKPAEETRPDAETALGAKPSEGVSGQTASLADAPQQTEQPNQRHEQALAPQSRSPSPTLGTADPSDGAGEGRRRSLQRVVSPSVLLLARSRSNSKFSVASGRLSPDAQLASEEAQGIAGELRKRRDSIGSGGEDSFGGAGEGRGGRFGWTSDKSRSAGRGTAPNKKKMRALASRPAVALQGRAAVANPVANAMHLAEQDDLVKESEHAREGSRESGAVADMSIAISDKNYAKRGAQKPNSKDEELPEMHCSMATDEGDEQDMEQEDESDSGSDGQNANESSLHDSRDAIEQRNESNGEIDEELEMRTFALQPTPAKGHKPERVGKDEYSHSIYNLGKYAFPNPFALKKGDASELYHSFMFKIRKYQNFVMESIRHESIEAGKQETAKAAKRAAAAAAAAEKELSNYAIDSHRAGNGFVF